MEVLVIVVAYRHAVDENLAMLRLVEVFQKVDAWTLSTSTWTDEGDHLTWFNAEWHVLKNKHVITHFINISIN